MKRRVHFTMDQFGTYEFEPAPEGQHPDDAIDFLGERLKTLPTIDNEEVVVRYIAAEKEFSAAQEEICKHLQRVCLDCSHYTYPPDEDCNPMNEAFFREGSGCNAYIQRKSVDL